MVLNVSASGLNDIQQLMAEMYQKMSTADTDGVAGLSQSELSSISTTENSGDSAFLESLSKQFNQLDTDGNGQLSSSEIALARPSEPMGPPAGLDLEILPEETNSSDETDDTYSIQSAKTNETTNSTDSFNDLISKLWESFLASFNEKNDDSDSDSGTDSDNALTSITKLADTNASNSISMEELFSIDTGNTSGNTDFINNLMNNFTSYDSDGNGELSQSELKAATLTKDLQQTSAITNSEEATNNITNSIRNLSSSFVQKLMDNYQNGNLSNLASSFNLNI